jgi:hypothetical protein
MLVLIAGAALAALSGCRRPSAGEGSRELAIPVLQPIPPGELANYVGSAECARCHRKEATQLETHHARTLTPVSTASDGDRFRRRSDRYDPVLDVDYRTEVRDGRCVLVATQGKRQAAAAAEWAFGSGNRGVTYTGRYQGLPVELRLSYYNSIKRWDFTPGQQVDFTRRRTTPVGRRLELPEEVACFQCHVTALVRSGNQLQPERSILGVGCESCHGPGRAHVDAVERGDRDRRIARLSDQRERVSLALCGQCHRTPEFGDPADPLVASQLPRLQGLALSLSKCFKGSAGKLSCITCHDPHRDADRTTHSEYNRACGSCHAAAVPNQVVCPRAPVGDCVSCHMPAQTVDIPSQPRFRTHWIKVWERAKRKP